MSSVDTPETDQRETPREMVNVALHPALRDAFVAWLDSKGLDLSPPIPDGNGETFHVVMPRNLK